MICLIRSGKSRELIRIFCPVKVTAVNDRTADTGCMTIHIFGGGMCNNIRAPFKRAAVDRCCKCIINDQRDSMCMCCFGKFFNIQYSKCRIGNRLTDNSFRVLPESCIKFFRCAVWINESCLDAHLADGMCIKIVCTAIYGRRTDNMISCFRNIHDCVEICRLSG